MKGTGLAVSLALLLAAPVTAQEAPPEGTPKREGDYSGVDPTAPASKPAEPKRAKAAPKHTLTWIGFAPQEGGGAELFFQAADAFTAEQRIEGRTLVVRLVGLTKQARNTRRHLDTRFFDTAISRVTIRPGRATRARKGQPARPAGTDIRISFKDVRAVREGQVRTETKDGMFFLYLGFGAAKAAKPAEPATP